VNKPQFSLYLNNGSASSEFFSTADPILQKNEAILWNRIKSNPKYFFNSADEIENILLNDPMAVAFAPEIHVNLISPNYPCLITSPSNVLSRVKDNRQKRQSFINLFLV
jgi:hypothetical protein